MSAVKQYGERVVSGMRPTGKLHVGHYHGVLKNWIKLQHEYECFYFVADWHALTTHYEDTCKIGSHTWEMIIDWLAAGLDPNSCRLFIQSKVPEHAELHVLLSMITPLSWVERVPTYKDQQDKIKDKDLSTYGFLGYPVLQTADVLIYKACYVPVGEDQVPHLEFSRELARRFNYLFGREPGYQDKALEAVQKMGKKTAKIFQSLHKAYQETGDKEALAKGHALIAGQANLSLGDRERLFGFLEGTGKVILPEPHPLLSEVSKMPGLDGQKMSKSYNNTLALREEPAVIRQKLQVMPTDPARVRRSDPGEPARCSVWGLHQVYSTADTKQWVLEGCRSAGIGCLDCKKQLADVVIAEQEPIFARAQEYINRPALVKDIVQQGVKAAREIARETLEEVRSAIGLVS